MVLGGKISCSERARAEGGISEAVVVGLLRLVDWRNGSGGVVNWWWGLVVVDLLVVHVVVLLLLREEERAESCRGAAGEGGETAV